MLPCLGNRDHILKACQIQHVRPGFLMNIDQALPDNHLRLLMRKRALELVAQQNDQRQALPQLVETDEDQSARLRSSICACFPSKKRQQGHDTHLEHISSTKTTNWSSTCAIMSTPFLSRDGTCMGHAVSPRSPTLSFDIRNSLARSLEHHVSRTTMPPPSPMLLETCFLCLLWEPQ